MAEKTRIKIILDDPMIIKKLDEGQIRSNENDFDV